MSAIDHAAVRIEAPPRSHAGWPPPSLAALGFVALWPALTLLALATEWRDSGAPADPSGSLFGEYALSGSAVSGPLSAQLILVALALLARRAGRLGAFATGGLALIGLAIAFNGARLGAAEPEYAPEIVAALAGLGFLGFGLALAALAARSLLAGRAPK